MSHTGACFWLQVLRKHVMVRVGGGWDTLSHYLDKHDPCRCRTGNTPSLIHSDFAIKDTNVTVIHFVSYSPQVTTVLKADF
jgi:hypothetical protein